MDRRQSYLFIGEFCLLKYHICWLREQCVLDCSSSIELSDITATSFQVNKDTSLQVNQDTSLQVSSTNSLQVYTDVCHNHHNVQRKLAKCKIFILESKKLFYTH